MASRPLSSKERLGNRRALLPAKYRGSTGHTRKKASRPLLGPLSSKERLGNRRALLPAKYRDHITLLKDSSYKKSNKMMYYKRCPRSRYERQRAAALRKGDKDLSMDKLNGIRCRNSCIAGRHPKREETLHISSSQAESSYFRHQGVQVQRCSNDNLNGYHLVPNHIHSESNEYSGMDNTLFTSNDVKYFSNDDKENNCLDLECDLEDTDQLTFALSDIPNNTVDIQEQYFDLSLDSDTESEEYQETLELQCDCDEDEGNDLFCSMQEQQCETIAEPSGDQLVYRIPDISCVSLNTLTEFDENNEIFVDLPSHDDLSSATVEVLAISRESMQDSDIKDCDIKDVATTSGVVTIDQLCNAATMVCFASSQNVTNEIYSPLNTSTKAELPDEQKQNSICSAPESCVNIDFSENESKSLAFAVSALPEEGHNLPVENVENALEQVTPKTGQTHEEVFMEALENYKKSGGHDTSLEKFENKNFTIQHESLSPSYQPSSIHAVLSGKSKSGRPKKVKTTKRDYRKGHQSDVSKRQGHSRIKNINSMEDIPSSIVAMCQKSIRSNCGSGDTPLHKACRNGRSDMALFYILDGTIDIDTQDYAGWSGLHEACSKGYYDIVNMLIKHGANVNLSSHDGTRPIHDAIEGNSLEIVKLLVENGADISVEREGKTLVNVAEEQDFKDIVDYLEEQCKNCQYTKEKYDVQLQLAVDANPLNFSLGYNLDKFSLGEELDSPLFYIVPTIESSEDNLLPLYNIAVPHKDSLRRHNFYLLEDIISMGFSKDEIFESLNGLKLYNITVADFVEQVSQSEFSLVPISFHCLPPSDLVELVPQCSGVQSILNFISENMDD